MTRERKAPKDWETWADFANCYDMVLFNNCTNLVPQSDDSSYEGVIYEWQEQHINDCESDQARYHLENCNETDCKECRLLKHEYGDCPECECEPFQWYAIAIGEYEQKFLNETFGMDIFYSDILDLYILPVYHFGTSWTHVSLSRGEFTCPTCEHNKVTRGTKAEKEDMCQSCYEDYLTHA